MMFKPNIPFNSLPLLPPEKRKLETMTVMRQLVRSAVVLSELKARASSLPDPTILLNAVILREARASSEIENVITTQDKLYRALSASGFEADPATKEVIRYREAIIYGYRFIRKNGFLSTNAIIALQQILVENQAGLRRLPGTGLLNSSTGKRIYTPPDDPSRIQSLMGNLERYLNIEDDLHPLIRMAVLHHQFESIHPFYDGNGRTGRIINILYLIMNELLVGPVLYLSEYIIRNKAAYYRELQAVRKTGNWEPWILYILRGVEETSTRAIVQIGEIQGLLNKTRDKVKKAMPKAYSQELVNLLFNHPYCKVEVLTERLEISRLTASKYLKQLESAGIVTSSRVWKEKLYINTRLIELLRKP